MEVRDVTPRQRRAGGVIDLEIFVVAKDTQELVEEARLRQLRELRPAAPHHEVLVYEERPEKAARGQLIQEVDHELNNPLEIRKHLRAQVVGLSEALELSQEFVQELRHEVPLVPRGRGLGLLVLLLHLLPKCWQLFVAGEQLLPVKVIQVEPRLQASELQAALPHEVLLEALEAVDQELQEIGLLAQIQDRRLPETQHPLKIPSKLVFVNSHGIPSRDTSITNFLVDQQGY
mmetsp:Transcript_44942/g.79107  ORF Transcript_44942/g.79107 Transcript_44942/m.79107 type:complete len:232 (+) Transcript_44942:3653-4348(+)